MDVREIIQVVRKLDIRLYSMGPFEGPYKLYDYIVSYGRILVPVRARCPNVFRV